MAQELKKGEKLGSRQSCYQDNYYNQSAHAVKWCRFVARAIDGCQTSDNQPRERDEFWRSCQHLHASSYDGRSPRLSYATPSALDTQHRPWHPGECSRHGRPHEAVQSHAIENKSDAGKRGSQLAPCPTSDEKIHA